MHLPPSSRRTTLNEAARIMSQSVSPTEPSPIMRRTGLVVGYVQSGKTLSFTTVTALARDNGYHLVIVIAGTSTILNSQSERRLRSDLGIDERDSTGWLHIHNPRAGNGDDRTIRNALHEWTEQNSRQDLNRTVLITVMKHHTHLEHLQNVLAEAGASYHVALVFDDEADQAGLNNLIKEGEESTTYARLREMRERALGSHTFLQYTATPQAPLLINLIDVLSPDFAEVLTPGDDYVGGREFFIQNPSLVRQIPDEDVPTEEGSDGAPPESFLEALVIFLLGAASGLHRTRGAGNRSMMVHPSRRTAPHVDYYAWVRRVLDNWQSILTEPESEDYRDLRIQFWQGYCDLERTEQGLESFDDLMGLLPHAIRRAELHELNARAGRTPTVDWNRSYVHIFVGGAALDRGFTVEGLTVTYMPRGPGTGQADTIQQRARFYGYKRQYLGLCRIYVEREVSEALANYVRHEESVREKLSQFSESGRPLAELRRVFLLDPGLRPTRNSVIDVPYARVRVRDQWFYPRSPHEQSADHRAVVSDLLSTLTLDRCEGHPNRKPMQIHAVNSQVSLRWLYEEFLTQLRFSRLSDAQSFLAMTVAIGSYLSETPDANAAVYLMSEGRVRQRAVSEEGVIQQLFQGKEPVNPPHARGSIYPGDRFYHEPDRVTVQIHFLQLTTEASQPLTPEPVFNVAIRLPRQFRSDVIIQDQGGDGNQDGS